MNVICVDDEKYVLQDLVQKCQEISLIDNVSGFRKSQLALNFMKTSSVQIAFLDIDMPDINGLEMANKIRTISPSTAIVFTTGYSEYAVEAFKIHADGYLLKPVGKDNLEAEIKHILENKTADIPKEPEVQKRIHAQTFGNFELFADKIPVEFSRKKSKELLAYLIDRRGASVTRKEMATILFEDSEYDRNVQSYLTKIISDMISSLEKVNAGEMIIKSQDSYAVVPDFFSCDSYDFLAGKNNAGAKFHGEYMNQYYWSETLLFKFEK